MLVLPQKPVSLVTKGIEKFLPSRFYFSVSNQQRSTPQLVSNLSIALLPNIHSTMSGKRKANDMSSSEPQEKLSKKAKLKLARERAAQFAQRDKEKIASQKSKKSAVASPKASKNDSEDMVVETKPSPKKKLTLAERKKIAMENAKEFAARDRAGLESAKKSRSPSNSQAAVSEPSQNFGSAIDPNQVADYERIRQKQLDAMMQQQQQQLAAQQQLQQTTSTAQHEKEMKEEDMPPPPPALMAQVSQQVLLNAQKEQSDDLNSVSEEQQVIANDGSDVVHEESNTENDENPQETKPKTSWFRKFASAFIIVAVAISSMILMLPMPFTEYLASLDDTMIPEEPLCYFNSDSGYFEGCSNNGQGVECPEGGLCEGGKLVSCNNIFQDVSDRGDKCVLDESYIPMKAALMNQLVSHASQVCDTNASFKYTTLQKGYPDFLQDESEALIQALKGEGFVIHERDGLYVGLPGGSKVSLPTYCLLGNIGQWVLQEVGLLLLGILRFASTNLVGFISTYPELSGLTLLLLYIFAKIRKYRASRKKRQEDIVRTREIAYKTLEESCGVEHCATHIRDEIAMALYPNSKKERFQLQKNVWPKIVDDVKRDTRIRKFRTMNKDGKARDMWQWTAPSKTPSQS